MRKQVKAFLLPCLAYHEAERGKKEKKRKKGGLREAWRLKCETRDLCCAIGARGGQLVRGDRPSPKTSQETRGKKQLKKQT